MKVWQCVNRPGIVPLLALIIITLGVEGHRATSKVDYYKILGVKDKASAKDIKTSFRRLAKVYHPDRNKRPGAEDKFREIAEAYEVLSNSRRRKYYDQFGHEGPTQQAPPARGGGHDSFFTTFNSFFDFGDVDDFFVPSSNKQKTQHTYSKESYNNPHRASSSRDRHGGRCKTVTQRMGGTVTTYTICS